VESRRDCPSKEYDLLVTALALIGDAGGLATSPSFRWYSDGTDLVWNLEHLKI
jgi:hypothetical protein